uniref:Uncharacterized protein n=1 Tax=Anguilla anguilla TaxID=7936 RepID=A0A0E9PLM9_ANGAN
MRCVAKAVYRRTNTRKGAGWETRPG